MAEYKIPTVTFYAFMLTRRDESDTVLYSIAHRPRDNNNKLNKLLFKPSGDFLKPSPPRPDPP